MQHAQTSHGITLESHWELPKPFRFAEVLSVLTIGKTFVAMLLGCGALATDCLAEILWVEAEQPAKATLTRHPWWYEKVKRAEFSGGGFVAHWDADKPGLAQYDVLAKAAGEHQLWIRANPVQSAMSVQVNGGKWSPIATDKNTTDNTNVAEDGKADLRFIAWIDTGSVTLKAGKNTVIFRFESANNHHGILDCFVLADEPFTPQGILKPNEIQAYEKQLQEQSRGWILFNPKVDAFKASCPIDLRGLNEAYAGEHGHIQTQGAQFVFASDGKPVRFWAVNGPPADLSGQPLEHTARLLAKYGVNLARLHGGVFDENGEPDLATVARTQQTIAALKAQGIYSHLSIYFPLWLHPKAGTPWLKGYDGNKVPFASLYFNADFQKQYRKWWEALLLTPDKDGHKLVDDPAVFGAEIINEDSLFFWTFSEQNIPDPQLRILEKQFGEYLIAKHGSLDAVFARWNNLRLKRDNPAEGRVAFRPLWNVFTEKTQRDKDTVEFLAGVQRKFYQDTYAFLRSLGFKGVITTSNWITANNEVLGPVERWTYGVGDFIDRHGYFDSVHQGDAAEWSLRNGHTYADRSALRFENAEPGKPRMFNHPIMDTIYDNKPTMISETTWTRPNRYRSEAPLFFATYGALQDSGAIVHFAFDSQGFATKPNFFMQPWTLGSPAMLGQFPAAALIYRQGLVSRGEVLAEINLPVQDILDLKGTPMPQDANLDELRMKDVPQGATMKSGALVDPLIHLAGITKVNFVTRTRGRAVPDRFADLSKLIDRKAQTVTSSTSQVKLNYGIGLLTVDAPGAAAVSGMLKDAGPVQTRHLEVRSEMELGHIILVSLDGQPLENSHKMLLQVMSEEQSSGFKTQPVGGQVKKIVNIGKDPWMIRALSGTLRFKLPQAAELQIQPLDFSGYAAGKALHGETLTLAADTMYYLITK